MIWTSVTLSFAFAIVLAIGYSLLQILAPKTQLCWFERCAFSFLLGFGAASFAWVLLMPLYIVMQPRWALSLVACGALAVAGPNLRVCRAQPRLRDEPVRWLTIACSLVLLFQFAALMAASLHTPLGWDGLFNFELKARVAFNHQPSGQLPLAYFSDRSRVWSHPRYPLLVPFAEFWLYTWLERADQAMLKLLFPLFFVALVACVCGVMRRLTNMPVALATGIALGFLPTLTVGPGATTGYADIPLAAAMTGALCCIVLGIQSRRDEPLMLAAALAAVAALTKAEGLLLALYLTVAAFVVMTGTNRRAAVWLLVMPILAVVPWFVFQHLYGLPDPDFPSLSPVTALHNIQRLPVSAGLIARELLKPGRWALVWPAFGGAFALAVSRRHLDGISVLLAAAVIMPLLAYVLIYLFSGWNDFAEHVRTSIERLLIPLAPTALMFTVYQLWSSI